MASVRMYFNLHIRIGKMEDPKNNEPSPSFQSTLPAKVVTRIFMPVALSWKISIHTTRKGGDVKSSST